MPSKSGVLELCLSTWGNPYVVLGIMGIAVLGYVAESESGSELRSEAVDVAASVPPRVVEGIADLAALAREEIDEPRYSDHRVSLSANRWIRIFETYTLRTWLHWPHRTALLYPGTLTVGDWYDVHVD